MNKCESLIVVEGTTDIKAYSSYIKDEKINWFKIRGTKNLFDKQKWLEIKYSGSTLQKTIEHLLGEKNFRKIIFVVDSDYAPEKAFDKYASSITKTKADDYWVLDKLIGEYREIPIYGLSVPINSQGCLETEFLDAYGYPKYGQPDYAKFENIIKTASKKWDVHKNTDNQEWFDINPRARMDKFIYNALNNGFLALNQETHLLNEPDIIKHIKGVLSLS
jgi:5S rRNA maturation endonuclease (ribonuclease M5)